MFTAACRGCAGTDAWAAPIWVTMGFLLQSLRVTPGVPEGSQGLPLGSARAARNEWLETLTSCRADSICRCGYRSKNREQQYQGAVQNEFKALGNSWHGRYHYRVENHQGNRKELQERTAPASDHPGRTLHTRLVTAAAFHGLHRQERSLLSPRRCPPAACVRADVAEQIVPGGKSKGDLERDRRGTAESCWLPVTRRLQCQAHPNEHDKTRRGTGGDSLWGLVQKVGRGTRPACHKGFSTPGYKAEKGHSACKGARWGGVSWTLWMCQREWKIGN